MKAVIAGAGGNLVRLADIRPPEARDSEILVDVSAVSVNRGELHRLQGALPGWRPGWDFAGTVAACGRPGIGDFAPGQRVFGIAIHGGAWAEQVAVPAHHLASVPEGLDDVVAAALPVAGLTAQRALRLAGDLTCRSILVTGGTGGVGRFAVQLASRAGAEVSAVVRKNSGALGMHELGARHIVNDMQSLSGTYNVILESVGGASLGSAFELVSPQGLIVLFGNSARSPVMLPVSQFYPKQASLRGYYLLKDVLDTPPGRDLATLADLVIRKHLRVDIQGVWDIEEMRDVLHQFAARRISGKAVLKIR